MEILGQRLLRDVRRLGSAAEDELALWALADFLLVVKDGPHERGEGKSEVSLHLHLVGGNREDVTVDPAPLDGHDLFWPEQRAKAEQEQNLDVLRRIFHGVEDGGQALPRHRWHRRHLGGREHLAHSAQRVVLYVARADRKVEHLAKSHDDALQCRLLAFFCDGRDDLDDQRGRNFVKLLVAKGIDDVVLHPSSLFLIRYDR